MFNRLPPELVRQIIESSVPPRYDRLPCADREALLQSLCLVCHLFRDIAQPLLFEIVWIVRPSKLNALYRTLEAESWRGTIRQLIFGDEYDQWTDTENLERILRSCQGLRSLTLRLEWGGLWDLCVLQELPRQSFL